MIDYLAFFNLHIRDDDDNFFVFTEDKRFGNHMAPGPVVEKKADHYLIECIVVHADTTWKCKYRVTMTGEVEMISSDLLERDDDLPAVH